MATAPKKETTPPTPATPEAVPAAAPAAAPVAKGGLKAWIPTIVALVVAPSACWAVATFVLVPQLRQSLQADLGVEAAPAVATAPAKAEGGHGKGKGTEAAASNAYKFENVVVNLAGTMGTRYLKTTFLVTGSQPDLIARFEAVRPQLLDITIAVLSSLTLHDLEEPGAKNVIREKLVNSYNQALGQRVAEQVYFSDFVVQ
ncbi:MAG TPA: flagellar basal body-associated FliL family protein [Candidatus Synoicihabitans sp.]|nr:flagellar basal body-associated FliL family protein [Candidatus Synoicihabitans sp.]